MTQINEPKFIIKKQKILLVEGKDEVQFFEALFKAKKIQNVQIIDCGGIYKFKTDFPTLKNTSEFNKVTLLAIIQDANNKGPQRRFESICYTLKNNNLPVPDKMASLTSEEPTPRKPQVGIFILPDCQNKGMLETLCLSIVESKDIKKCIDDFMDCMVKNLDSKPKKTDKDKKLKESPKARTRAYLSAMKEDTSSLGVAAQKGYWNFDSDKLKLLLDFLHKLQE